MLGQKFFAQFRASFFIALFGVLSSCSFFATKVYFELPADDATGAELIIAQLKWPDNSFRVTTPGDASFRVKIETSVAENPASSPLTWNRPMAAAVSWDSDVYNLVGNAKTDWQAELARHSAQLMPLEKIELPLRTISLNGTWPGEDSYPVWKRFSLAGKIPENWKKLWTDTPAPAEFQPRLFWIGGVGDIMPGRGTTEILTGSKGPENTFGKLLPIMRGFDLLLANLETSVTDRGTKRLKSYNFRVPASVLAPLKSSGIDWVTIANNHSSDWGEEGFRDTLAALKNAFLPFGGAGLNWEQAATPSAFTMNGQGVVVWAAGAFPDEQKGFSGPRDAAATDQRPGILWADEKAVAAMKAAFSRRTGFKVAVVHGGEEWTLAPIPSQITLYRSLIDNGADLVIAHHPHVVQPLEVRGNKLIVYSLGNFLFNGMEGRDYGNEGLVFSVGVFQNTIRSFRVWSAKLKGPQTDLDPDDGASKLFLQLSKKWNR